MSWATCYSGTNNIHFDFPPIMSDGRNYSNWQPGAAINEDLKKEIGIRSNADYRTYLVKNADSIIKYNQLGACEHISACTPQYGFHLNEAKNKSYNTPYLFKSCNDNGQPFGYEKSDLKNSYLSVQQLQDRLTAPILTQEEYLRQGFPHEK